MTNAINLKEKKNRHLQHKKKVNEKFAQWHSYYDDQHDLCICLHHEDSEM